MGCPHVRFPDGSDVDVSVPDYAEAEAEALTAFDEALGMFEQSLGSTPRVR
jgi:hypothetical protein